MASRRFIFPEMPVKQIGAKIFQDDFDFIQDKGQHPGTIAREALHIYCDAWRTAQCLPKMTRQDRDQFILDKIPCREILHTRPDPAIYAQVMEKPTVSTHTSEIIRRPVADNSCRQQLPTTVAEMRTWSKSQRDIYIMYGTAP
jgi:hypothetical protein